MGTICQTFLEQEKRNLSKFAFLTVNTKGREHPYVPCEMRTEFQRDRDRIVHCQSFRRLMNKTQVFLAPAGDHYRTRLTHTMEVSQIARIIARSLHLNEDLTEAAALGHDLGHTPFGHSGETAMQELFSPDFTHYKQSLRVVDKLENGGKGLNLTFEVRDGIVNHTGKSQASTLEGVIVKFADRIAYINHDIDDACRGGVLHTEEIPAELREILGQTHGERINTMVASVIRASENLPEIKMEPHIQEATDKLRKFLFETVYTSPVVKGEEKKAQEMIARMYEYFCKNPTRMPALYVSNIEEEGVERCVCDFIAGMTDRYAIETYRELFIPQVWKL
ncbi:MAG: deoxyguanosinetriphosphate triphosphohydrolase [Clostridia bacterium]|nr:deoxyguanosinetriphosphate triphosphohydrolase [Clostridia bacterium]